MNHLAPEDLAQSDIGSLNLVFHALSDPVRRAILVRLHEGEFLVSELAAPFDISLQAVSKHIQVLVKAGLITQERSGRINRCRLHVGPIYQAAVWINQYSKYWQSQFDVLAAALGELDEEGVVQKTDVIGAGRKRKAQPSKRTKRQGKAIQAAGSRAKTAAGIKSRRRASS